LSEPDGFFASESVADVRQLAVDIHLLSAQRTGDANEMPVLVEMAAGAGSADLARPDPLLGWYLRNLRNLRWVLAPELAVPPGERTPLVVTQDRATDDPGLAGYLGSRYTVQADWLPTQLLATDAQPAAPASPLVDRFNLTWTSWLRNLLRWIVYRQVPALPATDSVVLWVKSEE
jgi:hypothetical protein